MHTSGVIAVAVALMFLSHAAANGQQGPRPDGAWLVSAAPALELNQTGGDGGEPHGLNSAIAGGMSAFLPGAGQFYNGQGVKGGFMIAGFAASLAFAFTQGINAYYPCSGTIDGATGRLNIDECGSVDHLLNYKFWLGMGAATGVYAWSVFDAISVARQRAVETPGSDRGASLEVGPMLRGGEPALGASLRLRR